MRGPRHVATRAGLVLVTGALSLSSGVVAASAATTGPPTVTTGIVSSVKPVSAEVGGTVNPNGLATTWYFQYGPAADASYGSTTPVHNIGSGLKSAAVSHSLVGLSPAASYHYRLVGVNNAGTTFGSDGLFNTSAAPAVVTGAANHLTDTTATLNAIVNPEALATNWYFQYGTSAKYGSKTAVAKLPAGPNDTTVAAALAGLTAQATYHFRVVATNSAGTSTGVDFTFVTGLAVTLNASTSTVVYGSSVVLSGAVADGRTGTSVTIESLRFDQAAFSGIATVTTLASGTWSYSTIPAARTTFKAVVNGGASSPLVVSVRPSVFMTQSSSGEISTHVVGDVSFGAHVLQLQRLSSGLWVTWKHVLLNSTARATFATSLPTGRTAIRMAIAPFVIGVDQAAPGYLAGFSRAITYSKS